MILKIKKLLPSYILCIFTTLLVMLIISGTSVQAASIDYVNDEANLLTDTEKQTLTQEITTFKQNHDTELYIFTIDSIHNTSPSDYILSLSNQYNLNNCVVILVNMEYSNPNRRNIEIQSIKATSGSTSTKASEHLTQTRCIKIYEHIKPYFSSEEYAQGFQTFISDVETYIESTPSASERDYFENHPNLKNNPLMKSWVQLLIALGVGGISVGIMAFNAGGKVTTNQNTYLDSEHSHLLGRYDHYIRTQTVRTKRETNNSSGGGSHSSSSSGGGHSSHGGGGGF